MAYTLEGIIGSAAAVQAVAPTAHHIPLDQDFVLAPMTTELFDTLTDGSPDPPLGFWKMPPSLDHRLAQASTLAPIAYVEAEFFGGTGDQRAAVWINGTLTHGPLDETTEHGTPISQALSHLGVTRTGHHDEFDSIGLARHRHTEDWLS